MLFIMSVCAAFPAALNVSAILKEVIKRKVSKY
jgi:hypothetical protein